MTWFESREFALLCVTPWDVGWLSPALPRGREGGWKVAILPARTKLICLGEWVGSDMQVVYRGECGRFESHCQG